jgi:hypothetical protein
MYAVCLIVTGKELGRIRWAECVLHIDGGKKRTQSRRVQI